MDQEKDIIRDSFEIQRIIREYFEMHQNDSRKMDIKIV
jgi:hypothetical protein